ncbi:MAG: DEAD/DEAH box helicase [Robiginitomaculum sp.]
MSNTKKNFTDLGLSSPILKKIERLEYSQPTPIQAGAIPHILNGKDIIGLAQTGTGKTAAFALPMLDRLGHIDTGKKRQIRALILTPTRELAQQIDKAVRNYGENLSTKSTCVVGGISLKRQIKPLKQGIDVLVATPGRLEDILGQGIITLEHTQMVVLDEADQMLDIGFMPAIKRILSQTPKSRQTLLFSATMPKQIRELASKYMQKPVEVSVSPISSTAEKVEQSVQFIAQPDKTKAAIALLQQHKDERVILFSRTKRGADRIAKRLNSYTLKAEAIHGNRSQAQRTRALENFRAGDTCVLVATDVAARGIDIPDVQLVINFDLPQVPEAYVHRIGRTGRAGKSGLAIAFCNEEERKLLRAVEKVIGRKIRVRDNDGQLMDEPAYNPDRNRTAERTYDHTKSKHEKDYVPDGHKTRKSRDSNSGEKRREKTVNQKSNSKKTNRPKNTPDGKPKKKRRNRPGSRARKRHRAER